MAADVVTFGDWHPDDAYDPTGSPDAEQVARRLHLLRVRRGGDPLAVEWDQLSPAARAFAVELLGELLDWLRRQGGAR